MTTSFRNALGAASLMPLLATALIRHEVLILAAAQGAENGAYLWIGVTFVLLFAGIGATLLFAWIAAGMEERPFVWKLGWVLSLTVIGVATAPAFWYLHVRPAPEASGV